MIAQVGNVMIERQLLTRAPVLAAGSDRESEEDLADRAVQGVADICRRRADEG